MKRTTVIILFFLPIFLIGQNPVQFQIGTHAGYEYNVFNANKNKLLVTEEDTISALQSGYFQNINLKAEFEKDVKQHSLNVYSKMNFDYFPSVKAANLFRPDLGLKYEFDLNKNSSIFLKTRFLQYKTNRMNDEEEVLLIPTSSARIGGDFGYKFKPFKYNKSQIRFSYYEKKYQANEERQLKYDAILINFQTSQRFKKERKVYHYLTLELDFANREYYQTYFEEEEEEEKEKERIWRYYSGDLSYSYAFTKETRLKIGLAAQVRTDVLDERFGYKQWRPYLKWTMKKVQWQIAAKVEGVFRHFTHLQVNDENETLLVHRYLRASFFIDYEVNEQLKLTLRSNFRLRKRNYAQGAVSYLGYTNTLVSFGVKFKF